MKKFIYCLLPLFALQINSCASAEKVFSREALPKVIKEEEITEVTGFKNRIGYSDSALDTIVSATYNDKGLLIGARHAKVKQYSTFSTNSFTEYKYDNNGLLLSEMDTSYDEKGVAQQITAHTIEYDEHQNPIKERNYRCKPEEIVDEDDGETTITSYVYNERGNVMKVDVNVFNNGTQNHKAHTDFSYDKKYRLTKVEKKSWEDNYDDPEGYNQYSCDTHVYNGYQVTDISEHTEDVGEPGEAKVKSEVVCDYDSKYNLIHSTLYTYTQNKIDVVQSITEDFFEYNAKGLETLYKSTTYDVTAVPKLAKTIHRSTTYCGPNGDKIEVRLSSTNVGNPTSGTYRNVYNYYDKNWDVVKQEIDEKAQEKKPVSINYYFEY